MCSRRHQDIALELQRLARAHERAAAALRGVDDDLAHSLTGLARDWIAAADRWCPPRLMPSRRRVAYPPLRSVG